MVGVIAGAVNLEETAGFAVQLPWILIGMALVVIHALTERTTVLPSGWLRAG